jgi:hypothetical protein
MPEPLDADGYDGDEYDSDIEPDCLICGGEGFVTGDTLGDPLWYDEDEVYVCSSCRGSGLRKDMTWS